MEIMKVEEGKRGLILEPSRNTQYDGKEVKLLSRRDQGVVREDDLVVVELSQKKERCSIWEVEEVLGQWMDVPEALRVWFDCWDAVELSFIRDTRVVSLLIELGIYSEDEVEEMRRCLWKNITERGLLEDEVRVKEWLKTTALNDPPEGVEAGEYQDDFFGNPGVVVRDTWTGVKMVRVLPQDHPEVVRRTKTAAEKKKKEEWIKENCPLLRKWSRDDGFSDKEDMVSVSFFGKYQLPDGEEVTLYLGGGWRDGR